MKTRQALQSKRATHLEIEHLNLKSNRRSRQSAPPFHNIFERLSSNSLWRLVSRLPPSTIYDGFLLTHRRSSARVNWNSWELHAVLLQMKICHATLRGIVDARCLEATLFLLLCWIWRHAAMPTFFKYLRGRLALHYRTKYNSFTHMFEDIIYIYLAVTACLVTFVPSGLRPPRVHKVF